MMVVVVWLTIWIAVVKDEVGLTLVDLDVVPGVVGVGRRARGGDKRLDEINAEKAEEIDEGGNEGEDGGELGEGEDVERGGGADLVAPAVEKVIGDGEKEGKENAVGEVEREREGIGSLKVALLGMNKSSGRGRGRGRTGLRRPPSDIHE